MVEYFKKLKEAVKRPQAQQSFGIVEDIRYIGDIPNQIRLIRAELAALKAWRERDATPSIKTNIDSIAKNLENIKTVATNVKTMHDNIVDAHDKIKALPEQIERQLNNVVVPDILKRMTQEINLYVEKNVMPPIIKMKDIFTTLGDGVKHDIQVVTHQSNNLITTLGNEAKSMQTEFVGFGSAIKNEAKDIADAASEVGRQMSDAVKEITPVIANATMWAKRINSRRKRHDWIGAFHAAYVTVKRMMWEGVEGNKAIFLEMLEAYQQIGKAFRNLKNQFQDFGGILDYRTTRISNQLEASGANISGEMTAFTDSLGGLFSNMGERIKGGAGRVMKAIEYQEIEAAKVPLFETSEQKMVREAEELKVEEFVRLPDGTVVRVRDV